MHISLKAVSTSPNGRIDFDYSIELKDEEINFDFPFQEPVHISGSVCDEAGALHLYYTVQTRVHAHCARCNRPFVYDKELDGSFLLARTLSNEEDEVEDLIIVETDQMELDDIIVPELVLSMDMSVLCREDCLGLCPKCGHDLNQGQCGCSVRETDPRMGKLTELLRQMNGEQE